jgi:hypothetical protein
LLASRSIASPEWLYDVGTRLQNTQLSEIQQRIGQDDFAFQPPQLQIENGRLDIFGFRAAWRASCSQTACFGC